MPDRMNWDYVILGALRDGAPMHLKGIYALIDKELRGGYINVQLFNVDGRWGDRPNYTNVVRGIMSNLKKRGLVEHVGKGRTGIYRITDSGRKQLNEMEQNDEIHRHH